MLDGQTSKFETKTYNGISVIFEINSGYFNASQMCSSNGKSWRDYKRTKTYINKMKAFEKIQGAGITAPSMIAKIGVIPQFQGEYLHPLLIHFVAEWISDEYAFKVAELMDSINDSIHKQLEKQSLPDTPDNSKRLFLSSCETIISLIDESNKRGQEAFEEQFTWGVNDPKPGCPRFVIDCAVNDLIQTRLYLQSYNKPLFDFIDGIRIDEINRLQARKNKTNAVIKRLEFLTK